MGSSKGFTIVEQGHAVNLIQAVSAGTALTSDSILMENWGHVSIIVSHGAGSACTIQVFDSASAAASGASMVFNYSIESDANGDTLDAALQAVSTAGVSLETAAGSFMVIELDADELRDGYPWVLIRADGVDANLISAIAVLSGGRYQKEITATAIV